MTQRRDSTFKDTTMENGRQDGMQDGIRDAEEKTLVGMDAHSARVSLCVTRWRKGGEPRVIREISTDLGGLEATYAGNVPKGALTVLEASTNSFAIVRRLEAAGHEARVLTSDALSGMSRPDRVNDRIDARNLAFAYAGGGTRRVHVPAPEYARLRDIWFGYRNAVKDTARWSNRLWGFCSMRGLDLPKRSPRLKVDGIRAAVKGKAWEGDDAFHAEMMLAEYAHARETRAAYERKIEETVAGNRDMALAMQVKGVRYIVAFALAAFIEDVRRFATAKKLAAYVGLNPGVADSGKAEKRRHVSRYGRGDLKSLMVEAAQSALNKDDAGMHRRARRKLASGKERNAVVCALARKMLCHLWHILMGHPCPWAEPEALFRRKLSALARKVGKEKMKGLGHESAAEFVEGVIAGIRRHDAGCAAAGTPQPQPQRNSISA